MLQLLGDWRPDCLYLAVGVSSCPRDFVFPVSPSHAQPSKTGTARQQKFSAGNTGTTKHKSSQVTADKTATQS